MPFDALDSKRQNSCCFESSSIVNKTDTICQMVLGPGFVLLFYALDYSSFQDQDIVLIHSHLKQMLLSFRIFIMVISMGILGKQIAMVISIRVISWNEVCDSMISCQFLRNAKLKKNYQLLNA